MGATTTIHERIRQLRKTRSMSQQEFSERVGSTRSIISQIEIGKINPSIDLLISLVREFDVNYDWLMEGRPEAAPTFSLHDPEINYGRRAGQNRSGRPFLENVPSIPQIKLVEAELQERYAEVQNEDELSYLALPPLHIPQVKLDGDFRAFELANDWMEPTLQRGDVLVGKQVAGRRSLDVNVVYTFVKQGARIYTGRLRKLDPNTGVATFIFDNHFYAPMEVHVDDLKEAWEIYVRISNRISSPLSVAESRSHREGSLTPQV